MIIFDMNELKIITLDNEYALSVRFHIANINSLQLQKSPSH